MFEIQYSPKVGDLIDADHPWAYRLERAIDDNLSVGIVVYDHVRDDRFEAIGQYRWRGLTDGLVYSKTRNGVYIVTNMYAEQELMK